MASKIIQPSVTSTTKKQLTEARDIHGENGKIYRRQHWRLLAGNDPKWEAATRLFVVQMYDDPMTGATVMGKQLVFKHPDELFEVVEGLKRVIGGAKQAYEEMQGCGDERVFLSESLVSAHYVAQQKYKVQDWRLTVQRVKFQGQVREWVSVRTWWVDTEGVTKPGRGANFDTVEELGMVLAALSQSRAHAEAAYSEIAPKKVAYNVW